MQTHLWEESLQDNWGGKYPTPWDPRSVHNLLCFFNCYLIKYFTLCSPHLSSWRQQLQISSTGSAIIALDMAGIKRDEQATAEPREEQSWEGHQRNDMNVIFWKRKERKKKWESEPLLQLLLDLWASIGFHVSKSRSSEFSRRKYQGGNITLAAVSGREERALMKGSLLSAKAVLVASQAVWWCAAKNLTGATRKSLSIASGKTPEWQKCLH